MPELSAHKSDQAYCLLSALEAGFVDVPLNYMIDTAAPGERANLPALAFLLRHSKTNDTLVFDLGVRKDWQNLAPVYLERIEHMTFGVTVPADAADSLAKGGLAPTDIKYVCLSHIHFDHIGDTAPYTNATFLVGAHAREHIEHGYPKDERAMYRADLVPFDRTRFLYPAVWPALGPFPHALDFFGDGSLYVVDAGDGHCPGHLNVLARTLPDGGWVFLAGDSAHDWRLLTGEANIPTHEVFGCAHRNKEEAALHMRRIRKLVETYPRVRVLLAHDVPWYEINKGGPGFWPGTIDSL
ncbi:Metallo-hydrolase/oxidoreductase [Lentinus tigrinus ALCF2SS1-7]|uniref:Metallo-hydrolase/oxidoreductase n=1 Tax=Lentinus tigrinus ALCF2SS1-7 TaxID=1328758 RepID=UPI001165D82A|nr:Metallo-hydrolase/oxidoreductase [Lentinus tigrinus ALCF2SS1-7]